MNFIIRKLSNPWLVGLFVLFLTAPVAVQAFVPGQISYQGKLTDDNGAPVADDTYPMVFTLYDASSAPLWSEPQANVLVVNGVFNVMLPVDPGTYPFPAGLFDQELFLGVQVGTDAEMTPRQPLTATPYAFKAADADTLEGRVADEFADAIHGHDFADITGSVDDGQVPDTITIEQAAHADYAEDAGRLDGQDSTSFAEAVHGHTFAQITGQASDAQVPNDVTIEFAANAGTLNGLPASAFLTPTGDYGRSGVAGNLYEGTETLSDRYLNDDRAETLQANTSSSLLTVRQLGSGRAVDAASAGAITIRGESSSGTGAGLAGYGSGLDGVGVFGQGGDKGVWGYISNVNGGYAIYGEAANSNAIGVYGIGPGWAGYFDGNLYTSGEIHIPSNGHLVNAAGRQVFHTGWSGLFGDYTTINSGYDWGSGEPVSVVAGANGVFFTKGDASGTPHAETIMKVDTNGKLSCSVLEITGGSDLAEPFETLRPSDTPLGSVMVIDPENPGKLKVSDKAYDRCVAGIVSGAGGVNPGMMMTQKGSEADGTTPIALSGRVYCLADGSGGPIQPGDLLTTSEIPGHAMKVTDYGKAHGATLGKAMSTLQAGQGMVLVLVGLQ